MKSGSFSKVLVFWSYVAQTGLKARHNSGREKCSDCEANRGKLEEWGVGRSSESEQCDCRVIDSLLSLKVCIVFSFTDYLSLQLISHVISHFIKIIFQPLNNLRYSIFHWVDDFFPKRFSCFKSIFAFSIGYN